MLAKAIRVSLAAFILVAALPLVAQKQGTPAGDISAMVGSGSRNTASVKAKDEVMWNDLLKTDGNGRMRITLKDGSLLSLGTSSEMRITQHDPINRQTQISIAYGRLRSTVASLTGTGKYEVRSPTAVAGVLGTEFEVIVVGDQTTVICYSGKVIVSNLAGTASVTLGPGQSVTVQGNVVGTPQMHSLAATGSQGGTGTSTGGGAGSGAGSAVPGAIVGIASAVAGAGITAVATKDPVSPIKPN